MNLDIFGKACEQVLCQALGYDEGRAYYFLLTKNDVKLNQEFSYSKRYRLMKNLFELSAVGKIKNVGKDIFSYFVLPPSFLYFQDADLKIIEHLEGVYMGNFLEHFEHDFCQFRFKNEKVFVIFLLKYFMKDSARLLMDNFDLDFLGERKKDVLILNIRDSKRKIGIIDKKFVFEFVAFLNVEDYELVGHLVNINSGDFSKRDHVLNIQKELRSVFRRDICH